VSIFLTAHQHN